MNTKKLILGFTVYPLGRGNDSHPEIIFSEAKNIAEALGHVNTRDAYNPGGGAHCTPHKNLKLAFAPLGIPNVVRFRYT